MKSDSGIHSSRKMTLISLFLILILTVFALPATSAGAQDEEPEFTKDFRLEDCKFKPRAENPYFILKPGYQLVFEG